MNTITEKYNAVLKGTFKKAQFLRDIRLSHPNLITQFNGFEDAVSILKNKGMIFENIVKEVAEYTAGEVLGFADAARYTVLDAGDEIEELVTLYGETVPAEAVHRVLARYDMSMEDIDSIFNASHNTDGNPFDSEMPSWMAEEEIKEVSTIPAYSSEEQAIELAKEVSRKEGVVQHVNMLPNGLYTISDWYDEDNTIASFERGRSLNENVESSNEEDMYVPSVLDRAIRYELEKDGVDYMVVSPTEEEYQKAKSKALKGLKKDLLYYVEKPKSSKNKSDAMTTVTKSNAVDKLNKMQKVNEDHTSSKKDKYTVKKCPTENNWKVWEGDHLVKRFKDKTKAQEFADKKNKEQGLEEKKNNIKEAVKQIIRTVINEKNSTLSENMGAENFTLDLPFIKILYKHILLEINENNGSFESAFPRPGDFQFFALDVYEKSKNNNY
jgi:hypothetical protein